jgi:integrase
LKPRERYQQGSIRREARKHGDVWTLRWRENDVHKREIIGTVKEFPSKALALKACAFLRSTINQESRVPRKFGELVTHYAKNELPNKSPYAQDVYNGYLSKWITPKWQGYNLYEIHSVEVERWLGTLKSLANGTRAKLRNIMSAIYSHAIRWEFFDRNPIASVRQTAKRSYEPEVLTIDELRALLSELEGIYRTMVYTAGVTGCRVSEVAGLRWQDCCFEAGEIRLRQGWVRTHETEMKTEASKKPVPLESDLAEVLMNWRAECAYNQAENFVFSSTKKKGTQPLWPNTALEKHIKPAAIRAGITKRIGWHTLRHSFGTLLKDNGADLKLIQSLMRHSNVSVTADRYVQSTTSAKREAQLSISSRLQ